tara:strand:+ start:399 stop:584 length:186 start_codon:yes stop_codon:yes gene_type:complete
MNTWLNVLTKKDGLNRLPLNKRLELATLILEWENTPKQHLFIEKYMNLSMSQIVECMAVIE